VNTISIRLSGKTSAVVLVGACVALLALLASFGLRLLAHGCDDFPRRSEEIAKDWQKGSLIILVRHTQKCSPPEQGCSPEDPGLTATGINQARQIGAGIKALGPGTADIYYSPTARTQSTARTAFTGDMQPLGLLLDNCADDLMARVSHLKRDAVNLVLVTHSHCLNALRGDYRQRLPEFNASDDAYYGVALFFNRSAQGATGMVSCAVPENWEALALREGP
jgi:phosphohistidine phosphatase SixA